MVKSNSIPEKTYSFEKSQALKINWRQFWNIKDKNEATQFISYNLLKRAEPCKWDILLVSRILWHKRITPCLKEWRFWHSSESCLFSSKKTCGVEC